MPQFLHHDQQLLNPRFDSPLLDVLTDLEHLRRLEIRGSTPPPVFMQLKEVFHLLESLASADSTWRMAASMLSISRKASVLGAAGVTLAST